MIEVNPDTVLVALAGSPWVTIAKEMGLRVAREIFSDRAVNTDGSLVPRSSTGAVIHQVDEVVERVIKMVTQGLITTISGEEIEVEAESLCIHGDTPGAVDIASTLRKELELANVSIVPLGEIV